MRSRSLRDLKEAFVYRRRLRMAVRANVSLGSDFHVGSNCTLWAPSSLVVGRHVHLGSNVRIEADGEIGDGLLIANNVAIVGRSDHDARQVGASIEASTWVGSDPDQLSTAVRIGSDVWIGFGAIVLSGIEIGDSVVIGAGSVVTRTVAANAIVAGNPARVVGQRFTSGEFDDHWRRLRASGYRRLSPGEV